jgi:hypothetical protein
MALSQDFLDAIETAASRTPGPLVLPWPIPENPAGFINFANFGEWRDFVLRLGLRDGIPEIVTAKFERAQKLHLLAWVDFDLVKAGELVALTTLELALTDRYGHMVRDKRGRILLARLLAYMPKHDGLTDELVPMIRRSGGSVVDLLTGKREPNLAAIRNKLAHGYPFDGFPYAGLLELVRDLIEYAYRGMIGTANGRES